MIMGKKYTFQNKLIFDSEQQYEFYCWLEQLKQNGVIKQFVCQPKQFVLFQGIQGFNNKGKTKKIIRQHVYTPDFYVLFNKDKLSQLFKDSLQKMFTLHQLLDYNNGIYFQIKGAYNQFQSVSNFSINQKWVYQIYRIPVQKIVPTQLFMNSFVPQKVMYTNKTKVIKKKFLQCKKLSQIS